MRSKVWLKTILVAVLMLASVEGLSPDFMGQPQPREVKLTVQAECDGKQINVQVMLTPKPLQGPSTITTPKPVRYIRGTKVKLDAQDDTMPAKPCPGNVSGTIDHWVIAGTTYPGDPVTTPRLMKNTTATAVYKPVNNPPNAPSKPSGPTSGLVGQSLTYTTSATDPDNDQVKYLFDFTDDNIVDRETTFVNSGASASVSWTWNTVGTYQVKAKARDTKGAESGWSSALTVTISAPQVTLTVEAICEGGMLQVPVQVRKGSPAGPSQNIITPSSLTFSQGTIVWIGPLQFTVPQCPPPLTVMGYFIGLLEVNGVPHPANVGLKLDADTTVRVVYTLEAPDLIVPDIRWAPQSPKAGEPVTFYVDYKNQGTASAPIDIGQGIGFEIPAINYSIGMYGGASLGKGETRTETFGLVTFPASGSYQVKAEVYYPWAELDENNNTRTETITIAPSPANQPPVADANGPYEGECVIVPPMWSCYATIVFDGSGSYDPDGTIVRYDWDFGDGNRDSSMMPFMSHDYHLPAEGTYHYTACLTVTDDDGAKDHACASVTLTATSPPNQPPVADADGPYEYICDPYVITCKGTIMLDGSGSYDPDGTIVRYCWDFGDGSMKCSPSPLASHEYWEGTYTACLTVRDDGGLEDTDCTTVIVKREEST